MKKLLKRLWNSPCLFAGVYSILALLVFLYTQPGLSMAGDMNVAEFLSSSGKIKSGFFFITPVLANALRFLNSIVQANWWSIFSIVVVFLGLYIFLWFLNKRMMKHDWTVRLLISGIFVLFMWTMMLRYPINFTQTTIIASLSGFLLIADLCYGEVGKAKRIIHTLLGVFLLFVSSSIRWKALALTLPFELMILGYIFLFPCNIRNVLASVRTSIQEKRPVLLRAGIITAAIVCSIGGHKLYRMTNPWLEEYVEANKLREDICDYKDRYSSYLERADEYEKDGIKQSWIHMVNDFETSDANHFSSDELRKMLKYRQPSNKTISDFAKKLDKHSLVWISLGLIFAGIFLLRGWKNCILPFAGCVCAYILCTLYFIHIGRFEWRVTNGCILAGVISFVAMSAHTVAQKERRRIGGSIRSVLLAATVLVLVSGFYSIKEDPYHHFGRPVSKVTDQNLAKIIDYIDSNKDTVYLYKKGKRFGQAYNLWATHAPDYADNYFPLTANFISGCTDKLEEYGITDLYQDMLERPDIHVLYGRECTGVLFEYLRDYYDPYVSISEVEKCKRARFLRYSRQIIPQKQELTEADCTIEKKKHRIYGKKVRQVYGITCTLDDSVAAQYQDFYINVENMDTSEIYTYGMAKADGGTVSARILCMKSTWDIHNVTITLVGKSQSGEYVELSILKTV